MTFWGPNTTVQDHRMNLKKEIESAFPDVLQSDEAKGRFWTITLRGKARNEEV